VELKKLESFTSLSQNSHFLFTSTTLPESFIQPFSYAMKFYSSLLALSVFHSNVWETTAFFTHAPKATSAYLRSSVGDDYASRMKQFENTRASEMVPSYEKTASSRPLGTGQTNRATDNTQDMELTKTIWEKADPIILQGGALRTWSETTGSVERVQVVMKTEGRPLNANLELWHGPDNTPLKMAIYSEDGLQRPINLVIETPTGQNTVSIRNTGQMEFPLTGCVLPGVKDVTKRLADSGTLKTIQGGAIHTYPFDHTVVSVQALLKTGGRPLNARIELLQGPNNDKFVIDVYSEDGMERPFFCVIETPGTGNVVRIVNTATVEFPLTACVQPYLIEAGGVEDGGQGWDNGGATSVLPLGRQ
jgi:hypothetical protein